MTFKTLPFALVAAVLAGCGGDDSSSNSGTDIVINEALKGPMTAPALTTQQVGEGDSLVLNSRSSGSISADARLRLNYMPDQTGTIVLKLTSSSDDLDIDVRSSSGNTAEYDGDYWAVQDVEQGDVVRVYIYSFSDNDEDFELTLAEANRETIGLNANEYVYSMTYSASETCVVGDGTPDEYNYTGVDQAIVNVSEGYLKASNGEKINFSSSTENTFTITNRDGSDFHVTATFSIDPSTGALSSSQTSSQYFPEDDEQCDMTQQSQGSIVL